MSDRVGVGDRPATRDGFPHSAHPFTRATAGRLAVAAAAIATVLVAAGFLVRYASVSLSYSDGRVSRWFEANRVEPWDSLTHVGSTLANTETAIAVAIIAMLSVRLWLTRWHEAIVLGIALAGEVIIFLTVVTIVQRPRPPVFRMDPAPPTSSFPSGHTAAATVVYGFIAFVIWRYVSHRWAATIATLLLVMVPVAVGLSRLYRGAHFLTDVIAGAVLGIVWMAVVIRTLLPEHRHVAAPTG